MRIHCLHGYFVFHETSVGQMSDFQNIYRQPLVPVVNGDQFTFQELSAAPDFSIFGAPYLSAVATKTFAGKPADVLRANGLVYDIATGLLVPVNSITLRTTLKEAGNRFVSPGLIQPGSIIDDSRVVSYTAWFSRQRRTWLYSEVERV